MLTSIIHKDIIRRKNSKDLKSAIKFVNDTHAEVTVKSELYTVTQCVIDIPSYKQGRLVFPCGDGCDHKLTKDQQRQLDEHLVNNPA